MPICIIGKTHARAPPVTPGRRRRRRRIRTITDGIASIHHHRINRSLRGAFIFITRAHSFFIFIYTTRHADIIDFSPCSLVVGTTTKKKNSNSQILPLLFLRLFSVQRRTKDERECGARERERESKVNSERKQKERTEPQFTPRERNCARPLLLLFFF